MLWHLFYDCLHIKYLNKQNGGLAAAGGESYSFPCGGRQHAGWSWVCVGGRRNARHSEEKCSAWLQSKRPTTGFFSPLTPSSGGGRAISQRLCWPRWLIKTQPGVAHEYQSRAKERIRLAKSGIKQQHLKKKEGLNAGGRRGELIYLSFLESKQSSQGTPSRSNPEMVGGPLLSG